MQASSLNFHHLDAIVAIVAILGPKIPLVIIPVVIFRIIIGKEYHKKFSQKKNRDFL